MQVNLTWDDVADFYKKKTGRTARTLPMDKVYDWALLQSEIVVTDDEGSLAFMETTDAV